MSLDVVRQNVASHRARLAQLASQRDETVRAPIDAAEAAALIDREIAAARSRPVEAFDYLGSGQFSASTFNKRGAIDLFGTLASVFPDQLRAAALASLTPGGISSGARAKRLSEIDVALQAEAVEEELALRHIDSMTGNHERRRIDAQPAVLLAPLAELQAAAQAAKPNKRAA